MPKILLEIVCASVDDVIAAEHGGADRIELCSAMPLGGLTPTLGNLIGAKRRSKLPVVATLRPREAGFCYSEAAFAAMLRDAELLLQNGADGIAFGILQENGRLDTERCRMLYDMIRPRECVFHRSFDFVSDPLLAMEELISLGFTRILTSGQKKTAADGVDLIATLNEQANGRIQIMPGGGVRPNNVAKILSVTRCDQVHLSAFATNIDPSFRNAEVRLAPDAGEGPGAFLSTDRQMVAAMRTALDELRS